MGRIIDAILGKKAKPINNKTLKHLDIFTPTFSNKINPELNDTFMSCCQAHARHGSKFQPRVYLNSEEAKSKSYITEILSLRPNKLMNAPTFWEKVTSSYFLVNNVFLYLDYDFTDIKKPLKGIYPLDAQANQMEVKRDDNTGELYIRFIIGSHQYTVGLDQICHIARNVDTSEIFGKGNKAIEQVLKVIQTNYEGIENAIRSSAFLRFIVQTSTPMTDKVLEEKSKKFAEQYLGNKSTGIAYVDSASEIIQINSQAKYANADEIQLFENKIYKYLGINEKILKADFQEDEWASYYESSLEPLVIKLESELTYKLFTKKERSHGNKIQIDTNRLQTASMKTRTQVANVIQKLPVYKPNIINELLYLPKSDYGDIEYANLNFVKAEDQSKYQTGKEEKEKEDAKS